MKLTEQELQRLLATTSKDAWDAEVKKIKAVRAGDLPTDWYVRVVKSGLMSGHLAKF